MHFLVLYYFLDAFSIPRFFNLGMDGVFQRICNIHFFSLYVALQGDFQVWSYLYKISKNVQFKSEIKDANVVPNKLTDDEKEELDEPLNKR